IGIGRGLQLPDILDFDVIAVLFLEFGFGKAAVLGVLWAVFLFVDQDDGFAAGALADRLYIGLVVTALCLRFRVPVVQQFAGHVFPRLIVAARGCRRNDGGQ